MPTFCRHNRFIERCPICSKTLPGNEPASGGATRARGGGATARRQAATAARRPHAEGLRVRREGREADDGYRSELVPGLRASADAERLAAEIAFSSARLGSLATDPSGSYGHAFEAAAGGDLERASWICFLLAYLTPGEGEEPFAAVERAIDALPGPEAAQARDLDALLEGLAPGPRSSYRPGEGGRTLSAYAQWVARTGGDAGQQGAFSGDAAWEPERRFARVFERLTLPGLTRAGRYELLVTLGRLGLYELAADSLHLAAPRTGAGEDATALAAKRVFGIGDPLLLERRAAALALEASVPIEALDLALFNWSAAERATMGFRPAEELDAGAIAAVLGL